MSPFVFENYNETELRACGAAFVDFLTSNKDAFNDVAWQGAAEWTDLVLDWFSACHQDAVIDRNSPSKLPEEWKALSRKLGEVPQRQDTWFGEFLKIDLFVSRGPRYKDVGGYWRKTYWDNYLSAPTVEPLLALESEWKGGSAEARYDCVMHSAVKLAAVHARVKVLVFGSAKTTKADLDSQAIWRKDVTRLRAKHANQPPWLLVDVPCRSWDDYPPASFVLTDATTTEVK
jgi:hypothetical protein